MRWSGVAILVVLTAALAAGCDDVPRDAIESCRSDLKILPARTDILLVVDDSVSMAEEQENLRQNLSAFVSALAASPNGHDFQIGVTNTSVHGIAGPDAYPTRVPPLDAYGFAVPYPRGTIVSVDHAALVDPRQRGKLLYDPAIGGGELRGFLGAGWPRILDGGSPSVVQDVEANVLLGTNGSQKEEPIRAAELALTERIADGTNAGFLRPGARLAVVMVTDEDDCSEPGEYPVAIGIRCDKATYGNQLESLAGFVSFLEGTIAGEERDPVVAVIAGFDPGTLEPTGCATSFDDPTRLDELLGMIPADHTIRGSICDSSFGPTLLRVADVLIPQTVPLEGAPSDPHMLLATVRKPDGSAVSCPIAAEGEDASQAGAVYSPPRAGRPASLTFQGSCRLAPGYGLELRVVCAG